MEIALASLALTIATSAVHASEPNLMSVKKIWDSGAHNAFTDLIRFRGRWWCTFREGLGHASGNGKVRVIFSDDGDDWQPAGLVEEEGTDLRDPKLSVTPDGRLMLVMGGCLYDGDAYETRAPRISFSDDGFQWTEPKKVLAEDHWLWRVTWHNNWAWSVSKMGDGNGPRRGMLYSSDDGLEWEWITEFRLPDNTWNASETTLRFMPDEELIALTRPHWIGTSKPPYKQWNWEKMEMDIGGPNFIRLPDGSLWAAGRRYGEGQTTVLARMTRDSYEGRVRARRPRLSNTCIKIAEKDGEMLGYARAWVGRDKESVCLSDIRLKETSIRRDVGLALLCALHNELASRGYKKMNVEIEGEVSTLYLLYNFGYETVAEIEDVEELFQPHLAHGGAAMFKIIDLPMLLGELSSLLIKRLSHSDYKDWHGRIGIVGKQLKAGLSIGNGEISVLDEVSEDMDILISADDDTITKVIVGGMTPYEAYLQNELSIRPIVNNRVAESLETLFPHIPIIWLEAIEDS